ncbi:MAG: hypothetical protein ACYDH3_04305 [Candidatus Aminicenantales bacterium]
MIRKRALWGIAAAVALGWPVVAAEAAALIEVRIGYGGWTLAPFRSPVESRSEAVIQDEFETLLKSVLPDWAVTRVDSDIHLSSSGRTLSAEAWVPLGHGRFAVGVRGDLFRFRVPFTAVAHESVQIVGLPLAELYGTAAGTVRLDGFGVSLLGRWKAVSSRRFDFAVRAGVSGFPFRGRVTTSGTLRVETILGNITYTDSLDRTIAEIRDEYGDVPSFIVAPVLGFDAGYRFSPHWALFADVSISQGTFYSAGISAAF